MKYNGREMTKAEIRAILRQRHWEKLTDLLQFHLALVRAGEYEMSKSIMQALVAKDYGFAWCMLGFWRHQVMK